METTDDLVREIAAREAIRDLSARYCDCIWRKDVDGLVSLFADDGTFRVEGLEVEASSRGHAQLRKVYEKALDELDPRLFIHSQIVDLLGAKPRDRPMLRRGVQRQVRHGASRPGLLRGPVLKNW